MKSVLLAACILIVSACATPTRSASMPGAHDCFRNADVNSFNVIDDNTLRVRVSRTRQYDLHITGPTIRDLRFDQGVALRSGTSWICTGNGLDVEIRQLRNGSQTWSVDTITRAPAEQLTAHPAPQGS